MIANVAPRKASGAGKTYTITCGKKVTTLPVPVNPNAGDIVTFGYLSFETFTIRGANSQAEIPYLSGTPEGVSPQDGFDSKYYFVMPAEDVTIS
jgi:hypothetical protein